MKILVCGAHFTPAQAVIEELQSMSLDEKISVIYIGRKHTMEGDKTPSVESEILPKLGVKFYPLTAGRLRRYFSFNTIVSLLKIPIGFVQSMVIVAKEQPDVVLSFGGYVALPVVISAWLLNVPIITHEQTLVAGLSNRIIGLFADKIAVSFKTDYDFPKEKIILSGNPIRAELFLAKDKKYDHPLILILGGNQGSHLINETVSQILAQLTEKADVIHQTGDSKLKDFEKLSEQKKRLKYQGRYRVEKFIGASELGKVLKSADLCISRCGANTLSELAFFGVPTIAVPLPGNYRNEQETNAKFFKELGLCEILNQSNLNADALLKMVEEFLSSSKSRKESAKEAADVIIPDAAKRVALETVILA